MPPEQIAVLLVSPDEHTQLKELARQRGFNDADEYLRALIQADIEHKENIQVKFKRAFREALQGDFLTEEEFWNEISDAE